MASHPQNVPATSQFARLTPLPTSVARSYSTKYLRCNLPIYRTLNGPTRT